MHKLFQVKSLTWHPCSTQHAVQDILSFPLRQYKRNLTTDYQPYIARFIVIHKTTHNH